MNTIKLAAMGVIAAFAFTGVAATDKTYNGVKYSTSGDIVLGEWTSQFDKAKAYSEEHDIPLVVFWGNKGCPHCDATEKAMATKAFTDWQAKRGLVMSYNIGKITDGEAKAFNFVSSAGSSFPFMGVYWKGHVLTGTSARQKVCFTAPDKSANWVINKVDGYLKDYVADTNSTFPFEESAGYRYEAEAATKSVDVELVRKNFTQALSEKLVVLFGSTVKATYTLTWGAGESNKTVTVAIPASTLTKDGQQLTLEIRNSGGETKATTHITYVVRENSAANPAWVGEKLAFGKWTADLEGAKQFAQDNGGYTLVSIQGSMWCPDCANTDRNFLDVDGGAPFKAWAQAAKVMLVSMDIPNYKGPTVADCATPTLFSKDAYATTLARANEYPQSGADASLTNAAVRSGLGYLTRKGISDAEAASVLAKFHDLAYLNTDQGGFHRPEDGNRNRTGVPIFVLLKGEEVVARFTRFAAASPMAADRTNLQNYLKRFDEMIYLAEHDATEIVNNYPCAEDALVMSANGGKLTSTLSNADFQDAVRLEGVTGTARERISITGPSAAKVTVQLYRLSDGQVTAVGSARTCSQLSAGLSFTEELPGAGEYFALVKGGDITAAEFDAASAVAGHFVEYTLSGTTVYVPAEGRANGVAAGDGTATVALTEGEIYRFEGLDADACSGSLSAVDAEVPHKFFYALTGGETALAVLGGAGREFSFQLWKPGDVGFVDTTKTVTESVNDLNNDWVKVQFERRGGASGAVKVRVRLDAEKTTLTDAAGEPRYELLDAAPGNDYADFVWDDGFATNKTFRLRVLDVAGYDGDGEVVLKLEVLASEAGGVEVLEGKGTYTLKVIEDDKAEPGRAMVTRADPYWAKTKTVYVREGEGARVWAQRIEASDGLAGVIVKSSLAGVKFATENPRDLETVTNKVGRSTVINQVLWWANREMDEKYLHVTGVPAGKSTKVTLNNYDGFKVLSSSNSVTVVAVADDAPAFEKAEPAAETMYRYVAFSNTYKVVSSQGGKLTFTKLSGSLPTGLTVRYDAEAQAMSVSGVPTVETRTGEKTFEAVYQVAETRPTGVGKRTKSVPGLTIRLVYTVVDPALAGGEGGEPLNSFYLISRTYADIPFVDAASRSLVGTMQVTIPRTGKASAKLLCPLGTVSFSAKNFATVAEDGSFVLSLASTTKAYQNAVVYIKASPEGALAISVSGLSMAFKATAEAPRWYSATPASDYQGQYTIAMPLAKGTDGEPELTEGIEGLAPRGTPYLTLKMTTKAQWNAGKMTWAGALADGTAISGTTVLTEELLAGGKIAYLPVVKYSAKDFFSALPQIKPNAKAQAEAGESETCYQTIEAPTLHGEDGEGNPIEFQVSPYWHHTENSAAVPAAEFEVRYNLYGAIFDLSLGLDCCCQTFVGTTNLQLVVDIPATNYYYDLLPVEAPQIKVGERKIVVDSSYNPCRLTLSLANTGVVTGKFNLPYETALGATKTMSVSYKGVVLIGWSSACGCGTAKEPFVQGAWVFTDKLDYEATSGKKTVTKYLSVKRGDVIRTAVPQ